ncbi:MalY/PatB family protein [Marinospirillum alkaliphilum]|uniref:cysteine-S-conjugate beta-lyase n=1 Tax=Marinospirillum alkaliphilum DSM 21637 TaxID=1122209 RepID=A0A1K1ZJV5_9GAMM|nr:PatB family C-S lyase [Marinospirillum alkaliphilum]SFX74530.1 cystathione beta-lyase [Marinospirillum alkaliphilum DSM 21637]
MSFDFSSSINRKGSASLKWQRYEQQDVIPMWVADMDLASPPAVQQVLAAAANRGIFGYGEVPETLVQAFVDWCQSEYDWPVESDWLVWIPGVVPGFNLAVEALLEVDEGLLVQSPVYPPIRVLGKVRQRPTVDVPVSETDLSGWLQPETGALVLCHPQNPTGKVYQRAELEQLAELAEKEDLLVISDEIWADLILQPGLRHLPFAAVSEAAARRSITLMAPSKTFNIAGLSCAVAVIPDATLRNHFRLAMRGLMPDMNYLGVLAAQAAWQQGRPWLKELKAHLNANLDLLERWLQDFPQIGYVRPQATFVAWLNVSALKLPNPLQAFLDGGVALSPGEAFGDADYLRLNFGCPAAQLEQSLERMAVVIQANT